MRRTTALGNAEFLKAAYKRVAHVTSRISVRGDRLVALRIERLAMSVFSRMRGRKARESKGEGESESQNKGKKSYALQKPANTALQQQRLKAWHPVLTSATVLPVLYLIGIVLAALGGGMYYTSLQVNELTLDYTGCRELPANAPPRDMPQGTYRYYFHKMDKSAFQTPQWSMQPVPRPPSTQPSFNCTLQFSVPNTMKRSVFLYYRLTNYYQNHRRYLKNIDYQQLMGQPRTMKDLRDGQCKPLATDDQLNRAIYPCGLIANSVFNDTFTNLTQLGANDAPGSTYAMSEHNIIWPGEKQQYRTPPYAANTLVPPPFWRNTEGGPFSYPDQYEQGKVFDPTKNEHFQVWMRTAAFPTFRKLYMRNDSQDLSAGRYSLTVTDNYPVSMFKGTKSLVISTTTWIGGRNPLIGLSFIAVACLCFLLALLITAKQLIAPRRVGDLGYLSWNQPRKQR